MRRAYIDWARALAVLVMIEAHTIDAWTRDADRMSIAFRNARIVGGFAAPLFLWLAGVSVALSAASVVRRNGSRTAAVETICRRGLEIFVLAFLFRIQAFILSPGSELLTLFRVDILNIMGPAIVVAGLVWGATRSSAVRAASFAALTLAISMLTPVVRVRKALDALPALVQWYLRPAGSQTTFVLFPWAGFVFAGAAVGVLLADAHDGRSERRLQMIFAVMGVAIVALGVYTATLPSIYQDSFFWTSSPTYFAVRVGIVMAVVAGLYAVQAVASARPAPFSWQKPLETLGRRSLFVYWIHVELVYGYATWPLHGRLPVWGALVACGVFSVLMYRAAAAFDRFRPSFAGVRQPTVRNRESRGLKEAT
jgi:uncharacterized membrane protein